MKEEREELIQAINRLIETGMRVPTDLSTWDNVMLCIAFQDAIIYGLDVIRKVLSPR
jgi:hypothetical protein